MNDFDFNPLFFLNQHSALWTFLFSQFENEIKERYIELRNSILSISSIIEEFDNFINIYSEDVYIKDTIAFPDIPNVTINNINYIKDFIKYRLDILDTILGGALNG